MNKPLYEISELIKAHFSQDDKKFNDYAKRLINYIEQEGNILLATELKKVVETEYFRDGKPLTYIDTHKYYRQMPDGTELELNKEEFNKLTGLDSINVTVTPAKEEKLLEDMTTEEIITKLTEETRESVTTEEMITNLAENISNTNTNATANINDLEQVNFLNNDADIFNNNDKPRRHRRTKAELIAAGYYDSNVKSAM